MKFAFNVSYPDTNDFLSKCATAGATEARIHVPINSADLSDVGASLAALGMKAAVCPQYEIKQTGGADKTLSDLITREPEVIANYLRLSSTFPVAQSLGLSLPIGIHLAVKSRYFAKFGLHRSQAIALLNRIAAVIRSQGHEVILPVILDDVKGGLWKGVDFDIYDIEMMLSKSVASDLAGHSLKSQLEADGKRVWLGKAGTIGGYQMPSAMVKALKRLKDYSLDSNIECAFLWSDAAVEEYHWSKDGAFLVDVMSQSFNSLNQ